jgi:DNA-directed RNA polymerase subunit RPC12/RpoP
MTAWHCFKCKEKMMADDEIPVMYLDLDGEAEGLRCPTCGSQYVMEEYVMEKMLKGEKMIEEK